MLYVDFEDFLKDAEQDVDFQEKFFTNLMDFTLDTMAPVVINSSVLHKLLNHLIEKFYRVNIERVSRTEKNKGGDYPSTAYTVTAGLEVIRDVDLQESQMLNNFVFTFKGSSLNFLDYLFKNQAHLINKYCILDNSIKQELLGVVKKDTQLYQIIVDNSRVHCIQFNLIKIIKLKKDIFELNALDQAVYLSHITKFMELLGNCMLQGEFENAIIKYELFLFSILNKYFEYKIINVFN